MTTFISSGFLSGAFNDRIRLRNIHESRGSRLFWFNSNSFHTGGLGATMSAFTIIKVSLD
ncbi:MAG: hypothetical protein HS132_09345 [Planctomycetia bacterium]|nr:hypothetical protein [Planctomycetia bacterium]